MANSSHCYLPRFTPAIDGPKRPISMKTRPTPSQHAQLLTAWHEGRLESLLQTTWALVLHYYIRSEDICFGYQHIDGDSISSRHPVQRSSIANLLAFRLAINENDSIQEIVDKVRDHDGVDSQRGGAGSDEGASEGGYLPFNTILMLRTYRKANDTPSSPLSQQPILATALPDQVRLYLFVFDCSFRGRLPAYAGPISYRSDSVCCMSRDHIC
jgi:hypothetical protein